MCEKFIENKEETIYIEILADGRAKIRKGNSLIIENADGKTIENGSDKAISIGDFVAKEIFNDFNLLAQNNNSQNNNYNK